MLQPAGRDHENPKNQRTDSVSSAADEKPEELEVDHTPKICLTGPSSRFMASRVASPNQSTTAFGFEAKPVNEDFFARTRVCRHKT